MAPSKFCVYEAINRRLREVVIGISDLCDVKAIRELHRKMPPVWIARWRSDDGIEYRIIAEHLLMSEARAAAGAHSHSEALKPFRIFLSGLN